MTTSPDKWPYTNDPYKAAWADLTRYLRLGTAETDEGEDLIDAIANKYGLEDVPPWGSDDPVDPRLV